MPAPWLVVCYGAGISTLTTTTTTVFRVTRVPAWSHDGSVRPLTDARGLIEQLLALVPPDPVSADMTDGAIEAAMYRTINELHRRVANRLTRPTATTIALRLEDETVEG